MEAESDGCPILYSRELRLLLRSTDDVPDLACGQCSAVLASGVSLGRFLTIAEVVALEVRALAVEEGPMAITDTMKLDKSVYLAGVERPVLKCPMCEALNYPRG